MFYKLFSCYKPCRKNILKLDLGYCAFLLLFSLLIYSLSACNLQKSKLLPIKIGTSVLYVELADTTTEKERGLMYREHLVDDGGMLFIHNPPEKASYWMKNTFIPLSIAFLDSQKKIINIEHMSPNNTSNIYYSKEPCSYALEVNYGWFEKNNIQEGDIIEFDLTPHK